MANLTRRKAGFSIMDLTKTYPRSPYAKLGNLYMLGRTVDKARAKLDGDLGEYLYDCPLDKILFSFLQISAGQLLRIVSEVTEADDIVARIVSAQATLNADDIATFNRRVSALAPEDVDTQAYFDNLRQQVAPNHPEIKTWFDLIEAEEGRLTGS